MNKDQKLEVLKKLESKSTREAQKVILALSSAPHEIKHHEKQKFVTNELSELNFLADETLLDKITQLKGLLAHSHPNMSLAELVNYLCNMGLEKLAQPGSRRSAVKRPATFKAGAEFKTSGVTNSKNEEAESVGATATATKHRRTYISVKTRREVWRKAQNKCEKCGSWHALEMDHQTPVSKNGSSELKNLRLLCRKCNQRAAIEHLGQNKMDLWLDKI